MVRPAARVAACAILIGALVGSVPVAASAAPAPSPSPSASPSASADAAAKAAAARRKAQDQQQLQQLKDRIAALQTAADAKARSAQKADERYLTAKAAAAAATGAMRDARTAADAAEATAKTSRARAAAVAARLARTDIGTLPLDLMLNHASADRVLGGLSNAGQLQAQARTLERKAEADAATAQRLATARAQAARTAAAAAGDASKAYADAKRDAADAKRAVTDAQTEETALLQRIAAQDDSDVAAVCSSLGTTSDACDASGTAPAAVDSSSGGSDAPTSSGGGSIGDRVVAFARAQIGDPYVFAAAGPGSWDCSGLTMGAWQSVGVSIGIHSATAQYRKARDAGELVPVSKAQPGDLLFYTDGGGDMYHITIYSGGGRMIEAPYPGQSVREVPVRTGDLLAQAAHIR